MQFKDEMKKSKVKTFLNGKINIRIPQALNVIKRMTKLIPISYASNNQSQGSRDRKLKGEEAFFNTIGRISNGMLF